MDGKRLIHSLKLENFLSYGPEGSQLKLEPLNILIGPNASGKSNLIQAIELLRATPTDLAEFVYQGGGVAEWLFKSKLSVPTAKITASIHYPDIENRLDHFLAFTESNQSLQLVDESIKVGIRNKGDDLPDTYYSYQRGNPAVAEKVLAVSGTEEVPTWRWGTRPMSGIKANLSILSQRNDPDTYPALSYLAEQYRAIKIYRNFNLDGPNSMRRAQQPDLPTDFLEEDGRNLSLMLSELGHQGVLGIIVEKMQAVYEGLTDITVRVGGGTVQTFIHERGLSSPISALRLSDGTLRYLCLLVILYHPAPPPLICLEEPEVGLHPDLISGIAKMLQEASQRTQLIVTTHSDLLVSKFSEMPEAVVVCESAPKGTTLKRLNAQNLQEWLEEYSLGEVWLKGGIGGTRW